VNLPYYSNHRTPFAVARDLITCLPRRVWRLLKMPSTTFREQLGEYFGEDLASDETLVEECA
jgi:hypothetical protein